MRLPLILSVYVSRQFLISFGTIFCIFLLLIFLIDTVELLRRSTSKTDITFGHVLQMAIYRLPFMGQETSTFAILFGGMIAFWRLTRSRELVIARAAGISAWQVLLPLLLLAMFLGILQISVLNPLASATLTRYKSLEAIHLKGNKNLLELSGGGLWLRQVFMRALAIFSQQTLVQLKLDDFM